ncbi:MAG TPA: 16S rRNA (cytosine(1402)-N(4))-methyltransferase RsmH [Candidatus Atribacteria bacterium]|nr:16S rRNA (cytosine(1402)-N(4))-methyltransferase RsmH [Candidatus Atribacteria bacterium]HPT77707.1 16S rRNA (cytosine(1402)-N(4))-methyltransferase RsmH [Candidatus Atribacteria bacterium]
MEFHHIPVMLEEVLQYLDPKPGGIYADGTLGGGGHSLEILKRIVPDGRLIGIDRDPEAIKAARERLKAWSGSFTAVHGNYADIVEILKDLGIEHLDGMIMDLGVSSHQLDEKERGFTYNEDVRLDMRMDTTQDFSAYDVINGYPAEELARIFWQYGEERWSKRIAEFIVRNRPIETTGRLVEVIKAAVPASARRSGPHPARRVFQAVRIEVNRELEHLKEAIDRAVSVLKPGGRLCIITFHSLEDRIVKTQFQRLSNPCICPPKSPVCLCGKTPQVEILTRKPVLPTEDETGSNPRSRSAKLRACRKL